MIGHALMFKRHSLFDRGQLRTWAWVSLLGRPQFPYRPKRYRWRANGDILQSIAIHSCRRSRGKERSRSVGLEKAMPAPTRDQGAPNKLDVALGLRIRQRRKSLRLSQTALADKIGLTFQQIQKYERGANRVSFSRLVEIAHALSCRVLDVIGDLDDAGVPSPLFRQDTAHLRESGAPELLAAYAAAPALLRRSILKLVVAIAKDQAERRPKESEPLVAEVS
jgi:transcriptional regulator with XRE-family HTH domain